MSRVGWSAAVSSRNVVVALVVIAACAAYGCGEDTDEPAPVIGVVDVICSESTSDQFEGEIVSRIEVSITDPEDDVSRVTATVGGGILMMEADEGSVYTYLQDPDSASFIRCEESLSVVIRATDAAGNSSEKSVTVN